jgi:hypothetical protein
MRSLSKVAVPLLLVLALLIACNPSSSNGQVCGELASQAETTIALDQAQAGENLSCTTTADCVVAPSNTTCLQSCGAVMNKAGAAKLQVSIGQMNSGVCAQFASDGCPANPVPTCPALIPSCVNGSCAAITPEDAGSEDAGVVSTNDAGGDSASTGDSSVLTDSSSALTDSEASPSDAASVDASADASDATSGDAGE